jgi:hypothetical protein
MQPRLFRSSAKIAGKLSILCLAFWLLPTIVVAKPTTADQARRIVGGWLARYQRPLRTFLGQRVQEIHVFRDETGQIAYFVVYLDPEGFVIVPGDDLVEPIIAFAAKGRYNPSSSTPLGALVTRDVPRRVTGARNAERQAALGVVPLQPGQSHDRARQKWETLESGQLDSSQSVISDPRVEPLLQSKWNQTEVAGNYCFNYYTPNYYPCGCVATALAQIMRFFQFPPTGVGTPAFQITVDGISKLEPLRGGDGAGGPYDWNNMVPVPDGSTTTTERQAIGALTHDAGVAAKMEYASAGSGAFTEDACFALVNTFKYSNAILGESPTTIPTAALIPMINPNLDASRPVQLGIAQSGTDGGHEVVSDGYGYNLSTLYHHLNMGWGGDSDAWYNLPTIDASQVDNFDQVAECIYNIYTSGTGEIISGRVLDAHANPISGALVQATRTGGGTYTAFSNTRGIYALAKIPSASTYSIRVSKAGYRFQPQTVSTGTSTNRRQSTGNLWGMDFSGTPARALPWVYKLLLSD